MNTDKAIDILKRQNVLDNLFEISKQYERQGDLESKIIIDEMYLDIIFTEKFDHLLTDM
jgi:hypothetical protein